MNTNTAPGNTPDVATLLRHEQSVSRHTMSSREIAQLTGYLKHKVTALKPDTETGIERAAFQPLVTPEGLTRLAELLQEVK